MEVLLLQDVENLGRKNDLMAVGDGFALNYLLPRRMAMVATPIVRKQYAEVIRQRAEERERGRLKQEGVFAAIAGKEVRFSRKTTKTGKLYAAISPKNIVNAILEEWHLTVPEDAIHIAEPIKAIGSFRVNIGVEDKEVPFTVIVEKEVLNPRR